MKHQFYYFVSVLKYVIQYLVSKFKGNFINKIRFFVKISKTSYEIWTWVSYHNKRKRKSIKMKCMELKQTLRYSELSFCLNPNSTISSVQQNLRLDYILTYTTHPPHKLFLYTLNWEELTTAQLANRDLCVQVYSHTQTTLYYNRLFDFSQII